MTIKLKSKTPYWAKFSVYQSFESVKAMNDSIKQFHKVYSVTPAVKAVLNTIKLHAKEINDRSLILSETLKTVSDDYDYIIIDTPPALGGSVLQEGDRKL